MKHNICVVSTVYRIIAGAHEPPSAAHELLLREQHASIVAIIYDATLYINLRHKMI